MTSFEVKIPTVYDDAGLIMRNVPDPITGELRDVPIKTVKFLGWSVTICYKADGSVYSVETQYNGKWRIRYPNGGKPKLNNIDDWKVRNGFVEGDPSWWTKDRCDDFHSKFKWSRDGHGNSFYLNR